VIGITTFKELGKMTLKLREEEGFPLENEKNKGGATV